MRAPHRPATWAALTVLGVLLPFAPVVVGARTLAHHDSYRLMAPVRTLVVEALRDGRLPLWNPFEGTGKPLFAEGVHGVLHPVSLAVAALGLSSVDALLLAYLVVAGLGAFVLARALGARPVVCAGTGIAFALSGFSVSMTAYGTFLAGLATAPWIVAAARRAGAGARWGAVVTGLATAAGFLSGDAQTTLVALLVGTALAADAGGPRGAARALAGVFAGVLLAGVQIAATQELLPLSQRAHELREWERTRWALAPARLAELVLPGLFRGPLSTWRRGASGAPLEDVFADSVYLGAPLLLAAVAGVAGVASVTGPRDPSSRRTARVLAAAAALTLWAALGTLAGAQQALGWVPVWSRFRYAEKLVAPLTLTLCALGALGVEALARRRLSRPASWFLAASAALAAAALLALHLAPGRSAALATALIGDAGSFYRTNLVAALPHLLVALAALLAADRLRDETARARALSLLVALAPAAAVPHGAYLGAYAPDSKRTVLPLDSDAPTARLAQPLADDGASAPGSRLDAYAALARSSSALLIPSLNVSRRVDTLETYGPFDPARLWAIADAAGPRWPQIFRRFGETHVVLPTTRDLMQREEVGLATTGGTLVHRDDRDGVELWAVPHRPWAFFPATALTATSSADSLDAVLALAARGDDRTVVVESSGTPATGQGRVLRVERGTESLWVEAESDGPALLVVQDAFWPGWRATVDGLATEILAADHLVRAVRWPPGRHRLTMVYEPEGVARGLRLSAAGAALMALLAALALRRTRPRPAAGPER